MQKDISTKTKENCILEKEIDQFNSESKNLQEQFKQNKEISERYNWYYNFFSGSYRDIKYMKNLLFQLYFLYIYKIIEVDRMHRFIYKSTLFF